MPRSLDGSVVVITGASSGIGRQAALAFARAGARVVLGARAPEPLAAVAAECGPAALAVPTDVTDERAVAALAEAAVERFGRIDTWVNNAGVILYGRFEDTPADAYRRVIETNLFGQINGARAALPHFRRQGAGVLINMCSVWGRVTSPYVSAYVTSKFAVRAFAVSLRQELRGTEGIEVTTILPPSVNTPIFRNAGNWTRRSVLPAGPVADPHEVADAILRCAREPKREVTLGRPGQLLELIHLAAPGLLERVIPGGFERFLLAPPPTVPGPGSLFEPGEHAARDQWDTGWRATLRRMRRRLR